MLIKAIPKQYLVHKVGYFPVVSGRNGSLYPEEIALAYVRVDYSSKYSVTAGGRRISHKAVLFYDCRNSSPGNITFKSADKVVHHGEELFVSEINVFHRLSGEPHHYEIGLI